MNSKNGYLIILCNDDNELNVSSQLSNFCPAKAELYSHRKINSITGLYYSLERPLSKDEVNGIRSNFASSKFDVLYITDLLDSKKKSLFAFDMDSTLIKQEVIDELARANNSYEEVSQITFQAMEGKLDFNTAFINRCAYLNGLSENTFKLIYSKLKVFEDVKEILFELKSFNATTGIISGSFNRIMEPFVKEYKMDFYKGNSLEAINGILTGKIEGEIINKEKKKDALIYFRNQYSIEPSQTVAVGDGANDVLMLNEAKIGIGFHAKEKLKSEIINWIDYNSMLSLLFLFDPIRKK